MNTMTSKQFVNSYYVYITLVLMESLRWLSFVGGFGVLGYMARDLAVNIGYAQAKLILPFVAGVAVGQLLVGFLSDRYGRVRIFVIFCNLYAIASLLCLLAHNRTLFLLFRFLSGLASPVGEITVRALIADICDLKEGGKLFSKVVAGSFILVGIAPIILGYMGGSMGWRSLFVAIAILCCAVSATAYNLLEASEQVKRQKTELTGGFFSQLRIVLASQQYLQFCLFYLMSGIIIQTTFYYKAIILIDYFQQSKYLIIILRGIVTGVVGYLSCFFNAKLLDTFSPIQLTRVMLGLVWICSILQAGLFWIGGPEIQVVVYICIFFLAYFFSNAIALNMFLVTTQSMRQRQLGSGFVSSLTIAAFTATEFVSGAFISSTEFNSPQSAFIKYSLFVLCVMCAFFVYYPRLIQDEKKMINQ